MTFIIIVVLCLCCGGVHAQVSMYGGKGMFRTLSAEPITPTDIFVHGTFSSFMEKTAPQSLAKYHHIHLNATIGLARYSEIFINIVPYQDDQLHIWGRFGDTRLGIKYLLPFETDALKFGLLGLFRFPTGKVSNVPYEIFSTNKPGWGINALFTLDFLDIFPSQPFKLNLNLGYMDHSIYDQYFKAKIDQLLIGSGIKFSIRDIQVFLEYSGEIFFNNPGQVDFSQNSMRITPGVRFLGPWNNTIDLAFDFSLTSYDSLKNTDKFHKEYFGWKVTLGVTHRFSVFKYFDKTAKLERKRRLDELRKLEQIKMKREKANEDLEKMKDILDKKKSKGK